MDPHAHNYLASGEGAESMQQGEDSLFNKRCWENRTATCEQVKLGT